jgi:hypothetical protein
MNDISSLVPDRSLKRERERERIDEWRERERFMYKTHTEGHRLPQIEEGNIHNEMMKRNEEDEDEDEDDDDNVSRVGDGYIT